MNGDLSAKLNADVSVSAVKSQALPLALIGLSAISLVASFAFLALQPEKAWLPVLLTVGFSSAGAMLWLRSHKASELDGGSPTEIVDSQHGLRLSTDSRALESPAAVQHLAELLSQVAHRSPLPEPDGMVDALGNPEPQRVAEAQKVVADANARAESAIHGMAQLLCPSGYVISAPTQGNMHSESSLLQQNVPLEPKG